MKTEDHSSSETAENARSFRLDALAKRVVNIAAQNGIRLKVNFVEETLRSSPAESTVELLKDISTPLGFNYVVHSVNHLRDVKIFQNCLLVSNEGDIFYCRLDKNQNISAESLSDGSNSKSRLLRLMNHLSL